jgi:hypothetical protein
MIKDLIGIGESIAPSICCDFNIETAKDGMTAWQKRKN